ncbi:hypothetical protein, partial [Mesomycoplasma ovipneumoniae]|uniref:hypothetical protein n=1 Tax=Mesomycoplasma ovipneumoniae TaxID=29562 RepID=UPI0030804C87
RAHPLCGDRHTGSSKQHSLCLQQGRVECKITLTDSTPKVGTFVGYVLGVVLSGGVDQTVKAAVTIEIDGAINWA